MFANKIFTFFQGVVDMRQYGKIIAQLRKENNMTQAELGAKLNVTYQAVSKWENDQSQPDFSTMAQIAELFHVPLTIFLGEDAPEAALAAESGEGVLGYCTVCGNAVRKDNVAQQRPVLICKDCVEEERKQRAQEIIRSEEEKEHKKQADFAEYRLGCKRALRRGLIAGGIAAVILLALCIGTFAFDESLTVVEKVLPIVIMPLFIFTYVTQLPWQRSVHDITLLTFDMIGDGSGFFVVFEWLLFFVTVPFLALFALIISPFTFAPSLFMLFRKGPDDMYEEVAKLWRREQKLKKSKKSAK